MESIHKLKVMYSSVYIFVSVWSIHNPKMYSSVYVWRVYITLKVMYSSVYIFFSVWRVYITLK